MLGVETTGEVIRQVQHFGRDNGQARLFKAADNLANHVFPTASGLIIDKVRSTAMSVSDIC